MEELKCPICKNPLDSLTHKVDGPECVLLFNKLSQEKQFEENALASDDALFTREEEDIGALVL